jgi:threonine dehydrogenase-like Zn-dependent dehydrogenase
VNDLEQDRERRFDAVIDASSEPSMPALAVKLVRPAGRVVFIGVSSAPSLIDTRALVLADVTAVGILSASPGLRSTIELFSSGAVNPEPLLSEVIGLGEVTSRLEGRRGESSGPGPKVQVDPRK